MAKEVSKKVKQVILDAMRRDLTWVKAHPITTGWTQGHDRLDAKAQNIRIDRTQQTLDLLNERAVRSCELRIEEYEDTGHIDGSLNPLLSELNFRQVS